MDKKTAEFLQRVDRTLKVQRGLRETTLKEAGIPDEEIKKLNPDKPGLSDELLNSVRQSMQSGDKGK